MLKHYIAKIEGHGNLKVNFKTNKVKLEIEEGERLIEGLMLDRQYEDAPFITSRICGVCPIAHNMASIRALENAFNIKVDSITKKLRKSLMSAQMIQSHALHLYFLALSDYFDTDSTLSLAKSKPEIFADALKLKQISDHLSDCIAGRNVHPITTTVGGFTQIPTKEKLKSTLKELKSAIPAAKRTIELFSSFDYPSLQNPTKYLCLTSSKGYTTFSDTVESSSGEIFKSDKYTMNIIEKVVKNSPAKYATYQGLPFLLGAISRLSNHPSRLNKETKPLYDKYKENLGNFPAFNSFHNNFAQAIEIHHFLLEAIDNIQDLIDSKNYIYKKPSQIKLKKCRGFATVEAPRGILYHYYEITENGTIKNCNIITPTAQSLTNLDVDAKKLLEQTKDLKKEKRIELIEMLIRAYDPCITCSVH